MLVKCKLDKTGEALQFACQIPGIGRRGSLAGGGSDSDADKVRERH